MYSNCKYVEHKSSFKNNWEIMQYIFNVIIISQRLEALCLVSGWTAAKPPSRLRLESLAEIKCCKRWLKIYSKQTNFSDMI